MKTFAIVFNFGVLIAGSQCVLSSRLVAEPYVLNPHQAPNSVSKLSMSTKDESAWMSKFLLRVSIASNQDRMSLKDDQGNSLSSVMKEASQAYLELRMDEAQKAADRALELIASQWPYSKMLADTQELYALKIMANDPNAETLSPELWSFADQNDFVSTLPIKFQSELGAIKPTSATFAAKQFDNADRVFVFGVERKFPITLKTGRWLIHTLKGDELSAYWVNFGANSISAPDLSRLWSRSIWKNISHTTLKSHLIASRPAHLPAAGITVIVKEKNSEASPLLISSSAADTSILKSPPKDLSSSWSNDLDPQITEESNSQSIFKSPWFWVIAGTIAGVGGYFAYQASSPNTVTTR